MRSPLKTVAIPLNTGRIGYITAGPTKDLPDTHMLVRCAAEIPVHPERVFCSVAVHDFKPFVEDDLLARVPTILKALDEGKKLYVGCWGGTGRTGTLLAVLVGQHQSFSGEQAIDYIRDNYKKGAVETKDQEDQVCDMSEIDMVYENAAHHAMLHLDPDTYEPPTEIAPAPQRSRFSRLFGLLTG